MRKAHALPPYAPRLKANVGVNAVRFSAAIYIYLILASLHVRSLGSNYHHRQDNHTIIQRSRQRHAARRSSSRHVVANFELRRTHLCRHCACGQDQSIDEQLISKGGSVEYSGSSTAIYRHLTHRCLMRSKPEAAMMRRWFVETVESMGKLHPFGGVAVWPTGAS